MTRRALCGVVVLAGALAAHAGTLPEEWQRVQLALASASAPSIEEAVKGLQGSADAVGARRLTPYAKALCTWAEVHGGLSGAVALEGALTLDPELPGPRFLQARWRWREGEVLGATWSWIRGCVLLLGDGPSRGLLAAAAAGWLLLALAAGLTTTVVVQTVRCLRETAHDAWELGRSLFQPLNAAVFAVVVLALPVFAGLGPVWLVSWLFALGWIYLDRSNRVGAVVICVLLAVSGAGFELWQAAGLRTAGLPQRTARILEERQADLSTVREFRALESELGDRAAYQLVLGELLRLHGDLVGAKVAFQKAVVDSPNDFRAYAFLGGMVLEDGDVARAVQSFNRVIELNPRNVVAYRNLSYAYDQSYRFQAADSARNKADELVKQGLEVRSVPGRVARISFPQLGRDEITAVFSGTDAPGLAAESRTLGVSVSWLFRPVALPFWAATVIGTVILAVRGRFGWRASSCIRCGRLFCARCKSAVESESYCSQCISVFLKRDVVSIEQQSAKLAQIHRWELAVSSGRRLVSVVLPGSGPVLRGRLWLGAVSTTAAWFLALGVVVVVPTFLTAIEPQASWLPLELLLAVAFCGVWLQSVVGNWRRR